MNEVIVVNKYKVVSKDERFEYVDCMRPNALGNPFFMKDESERVECIARFKKYLWVEMNKGGSKVAVELNRLLTCEKTVVLMCCCHPKPCHCDVIKKAIEWITRDN